MSTKMTNIFLYLVLGVCAGVLSGLVGIGGATIIIPALIFYLLFYTLYHNPYTIKERI